VSGPTGRKLTRARIAKMLTYLMDHGCTKSELAKRMQMSRTCAGDWVNALHAAHCVYIAGYTQTLRNGTRATIYRWGQSDDVPKPLALTSAQRVARCRDKSTIDRAWKMPSTRARDAAIARCAKESAL